MSQENEDLGRDIRDIYNESRKKVLLIGQSSLPKDQFEAFRKMALDAFADADRRLQELLKGKKKNQIAESETHWKGKGRPG